LGQNRNFGNREITKIVVYDLPSENQLGYQPSEKADIRRVRVRATQLLHMLGVQCTESVILVPRSRVNQINNIIQIVMNKYQELDNRLNNTLGLPIIRVLDLTIEQKEELIPIAKRRLIRELDRTINLVSRAIDELNETIEARERRKIINRIRRIARNWSRIFDIANELGIDLSRDYEYLVSLIDEALEGR